jgi:hypothetical protein
MTTSVHAMLSSKKAHKEIVLAATKAVLRNKGAISEAIEILQQGSDVERGTISEVLKYVSAEQPEIVVPYMDVIIEHIDDKAPRVRWGCPESIGNVAKKYPGKVEGAIPKLVGNLKDKSTVVRWCAAYALSEIIKTNKKRKKELMELFHGIMAKENNYGVRNVLITALKEVEPESRPS